MAAHSQSAHKNNEVGAKMEIEENNELSTQNTKAVKNQNKNSRITMDPRLFLM